MHPFRNRTLRGTVFALATVSAAACSDGARAPFESGTPASDALPLLQNANAPAGQRVAQLVALALRDASARGIFHRATTSSSVKEGKLFLNSFLGGEGTPVLQAMARAGGLTITEVQALVAETGPVEIYLPVPEHRAAWKGGDDVIVAYSERDRAQPFGFALDGRAVELSAREAPATPTIMVTYAESFDARGKPHGTDVRGQAPRPNTLGAARRAVLTVPFTGLWVDSIKTNSDYEAWSSGSPEFELYVQNAETRANISCSGESSVEPYKFNMDDTGYSHPVLLAQEPDLPAGVPVVIAMYEDDDERCVIKQDKDYVKLATDALTNAASAYKSLTSKEWVNGEWIMQIRTAYVNVVSFLRGNDEFVGVSSGLENIDSIDRHYFLKNEAMNSTGVLRLQWKTDTGY